MTLYLIDGLTSRPWILHVRASDVPFKMEYYIQQVIWIDNLYDVSYISLIYKLTKTEGLSLRNFVAQVSHFL